MEENFSQILSQAQNIKNSELIPLPEPKKLANPDSQQEYILTHRYTFSPNTFICTDLSSNNLHVKVIPCPSYSAVQQGANKLRRIQQKCKSNALLETFDSFGVLDRRKWFLVVVTPTMDSVTLSDLGKHLKNSDTLIPRHHTVSILSTILEILEETPQESSLNCIFANSVMICKNSAGPNLFKLKSQQYSLKLSPASRVTLLNLQNSLSHTKRTLTSDLWDLSTSLYSLIGKSPIDSLPCMKNLSLKEIQDLTPLSYEDPALEEIFRQLQKSDYCVVKSNFLKIWRGCLNSQSEVVERASIEDLPVLHSILLFTPYKMKSMILKQLLLLGQKRHEVYVYLNENNIFWLFIEECLQISWEGNKLLLKAFFKILKQKPQNYASKQKLRQLGIFGLIYTSAKLEMQSKSFFEFIRGFVTENTLTAMQILFDTGIVNKALENIKKSSTFKMFIKDTMSYYGPNSPKLIEEVHGLEIFNAVIVIQALIDIPYYFRFEKLEHVFSLILTMLKKKKFHKDEFIEVVKHIVRLLTEILSLPLLLQNSHLSLSCTSHTQTDLFFLTKNPLLYYCKECSEPLCSTCFKDSEHQQHEFYNLLYITPHFRCNCGENHEQSIPVHLDFTLPKYRARFTFLPSPGTTTTESYINKFYSKSDLVITTIEPLVTDWNHTSSNVIVYYEVKVIQAGQQENIIIGFLGAEVTYEGMTGNICIGNRVVCKASRFGSYDIVGIGILRNQQAFFTYNGLLSSYFVDVEASQKLKIYITLCGDGCEIEVKLRNFFFKSFKPGLESLSKDANSSLQEIFKYLISVSKKNNEPRLQEAKKDLANLLKSIGKEKLAKKLF